MGLRLLPGLLLLADGASGAAGAPAGRPDPPAELAPVPVAMLVDLGSGRTLYARNPDRRFLPASMVKAMTAYTAFGLLERGKLSAERSFAVSEATARQWRGRGTSLYLAAGSSTPADILLRGITTVSANDAAVVLAEGYAGSVPAWTALMNAEARSLGMTNSHFATPNGWPDAGASYVSARDLATLGAAMAGRYPEFYRRYFGQRQLTWNGRTQLNKDPVTGIVAGADGIKTGHTAEAGYNFLGSAERQGRRLVMVVAGARSEMERAQAARALLEWGFAGWSVRPLFASGTAVGHARVQGGDARRLALRTGGIVSATVPRGASGPISLRLSYRGPLVAPIAKGRHVADLEIRYDGGESGTVPLYAAADVGPAGPIDRLINGLAGLFS